MTNAAESAALPPKPLRPRDEDCCGNDCPLCEFTRYERELERWQERVAESQAAQCAVKHVD